MEMTKATSKVMRNGEVKPIKSEDLVVGDVIVDYVLKINNNKLVKNFVEVIASQWKKANIETVEDAMNIAELEYKKRKNVTAKSTKVTKVEKPVWFNKEIEEQVDNEQYDEVKKNITKYKKLKSTNSYKKLETMFKNRLRAIEDELLLLEPDVPTVPEQPAPIEDPEVPDPDSEVPKDGSDA